MTQPAKGKIPLLGPQDRDLREQWTDLVKRITRLESQVGTSAAPGDVISGIVTNPTGRTLATAGTTGVTVDIPLLHLLNVPVKVNHVYFLCFAYYFTHSANFEYAMQVGSTVGAADLSYVPFMNPFASNVDYFYSSKTPYQCSTTGVANLYPSIKTVTGTGGGLAISDRQTAFWVEDAGTKNIWSWV